MENTRLGSTGLRINRQAVELGITFWDTANVYQAGTPEEIVGRAIRYSRREDTVLASKVRGRMNNGAGGEGPSQVDRGQQVSFPTTVMSLPAERFPRPPSPNAFSSSGQCPDEAR